MRSLSPLALVFAVMFFVPPRPALAQVAAAQPETHYITVTTFNVPLGDDFDAVMAWVDSVQVPQARRNPNVLSYRVAVHNWGSKSGDVALMSEWPNWAAIGATCEPCDRWADETRPEEKWPEAQATWLKYFTNHRDEIYFVDMSRAK